MNDNDNIIANALAYAKSVFGSDATGHDFYHTQRVYDLSRLICSKEGGDLFVVSLAALLHDVDDPKLFATENLANARGFLGENGVASEVIERICHIISQVSFKAGDTKVPDSLEGKIVQDADRLDAIGAIGIARAFAYGGSHGRPIYEPSEVPMAGMDEKTYRAHAGCTVNHFYEKLLLLKDMMNTPTARALATHRDCVMRTFLDEFLKEWGEGAREN
jgi:uncharacterized protein